MKKFFPRLTFIMITVYLLSQTATAARLLIPGGQVIGLHLADDRITVAAIDPELGRNARAAGLATGDRLLSIDNTPITAPEDVTTALNQANGPVELRIERSGKTKKCTLQPVTTPDGPRLGVSLRQGTTGLGTVTFYDPQTHTFGALGHGVNGPDNAPVKMTDGNAYTARVTGVRKGSVGTPGQLLGAVTDPTPLGELEKNTVQGVFGTAQLASATPLPVADHECVHTGPATIRSTVSDKGPQEYSVEILKIYPGSENKTRNLLIRVTDPALLTTTGGIVQGMSGSPIIQDGYLIGAVTHVLVNDPTTGYGIFIENMLSAAA